MQKNKGFTLLELLLALGMLGVLALGISSWTQGFFRVQSSSAMRLSNQSDINQVFSAFSKALKLADEQKDLEFEQKFNYSAAGVLSMNLNVKDKAVAGVGTFVNLDAIWNPADMSQTRITAVPDAGFAAGENLGFELRNFAPYARLKDYDGYSGIDAADKTKLENCLAQIAAGQTLTSCFDPSCGSLNNIDVQSLPPSGDCLKKSVFPFIEFSEDKKILYFSVRPVRYEAVPGTTRKRIVQGRGVTKAVIWGA